MSRKKRKWDLKRLVISALRKIFFYSPLRREALERAKVGKLFRCAKSKKKLPINEVTVDHVIPVVDPAKGFTTWDEFISRLFCSVDNLQVLSKEEHAKKTKSERKKRAETKRQTDE